MNQFVVANVMMLFLSLLPLNAMAENQMAHLSNDAHSVVPALAKVSDPAGYYHKKNQAIALCKQEKCDLALTDLKALTAQYQDDGETWYLLGLSYRQTGELTSAANALIKSLSLGSRLKGIATGASNPNDLMMLIAEIYAQLQDEAATQLWIKKALAQRWDDRPKLAGSSLFQQGISPHFEAYKDKAWFTQLAGSLPAETNNRIEGWRGDLAYLASEIKRLHVDPFHSVSEADFNQKVQDIHAMIPKANDQEIVFQFMALLGLLNNGHNFVIPAWGQHGNFSQLPMQFYQFSDGLFVVDAAPKYKKYIGHKVIQFNNTPTDKALLLTDAINPKDNNMQRLWLGPHYLRLPHVLTGLGIARKNDSVTLTLKNQLLPNQSKDAGVKLTPVPVDMTFSGFPTLPPAQNQEDIPSYLSQNNNPYWKKWMSNGKVLYFQFNAVRNKSEESFAEFNSELQQALRQKTVESLIIDLRHNSGGDGSITPPIVKTAVLFEALNPTGKLFVVVGRNTFSAGHDTLMKLLTITDAIVVGEPSGTRPNTIGEAGWFNLPYSRQTGIISSQFHQKGAAEDHRIWIAPDVPVSLSSKEYFSGKDPALDAIFELLDNQR